jgi:nucleotide-binding universal stress UspA family protein
MGSTLLFLQVVEPVYDLVGPEGTIIDVGRDLVEKRIEEAGEYVRRLASEFNERGLKANGLVETGPVVAAIHMVADREGVDLITMASHGRSGLARVFYGSVAIGMLNRIDRPLLLIRAEG